MVEPLRHRQTKEAATAMFDLQPRHISTLHLATTADQTLCLLLVKTEKWRKVVEFAGVSAD
jgi:hypothetical protein